MATRTDTLKVVYVVDGQSNVVGSFRAVGKEADELDKRVAGAGKGLDGVAAAASRLGTALGIGVGTAVTATATALGLYIRNTMEAEKTQAQLAARIRDTGAAAGRTIEQLNAQASQMQRVTLFDDNAVGNAQAVLLTFRDLQGLNFDRAVEGAADLATALGTDIESAARMLGRALESPAQGLRSLAAAGVVFTSEERKALQAMVESGEKAEAMAVILDRLNGSVGSAAEASGDTLAGALTKLKNAANSAMQGDGGGEGMQGLKRGVEDLADALNDQQFQQAIDTIAEGLLSIGAAAADSLAELVEWNAALREAIGISGTDIGRALLAGLTGSPTKAVGILAKETNTQALGKGAKDIFDVISGVASGNPVSIVDGLTRIADRAEPWTIFSNVRGGSSTAARAPSGASITPLPEKTGKRRPDEKDREWEDYVKDMTALEGVWRDSAIEQANRENDARNERAEAIERGRAQTEALIADMEQELRLIGATAEERERAIALRYADANATDEQRERIAGLATEIARAREAQYVIDDIKGTFISFGVEAAMSFGSAGDAVEEFGERLQRIAWQVLADKAVQWLFGAILGGGTESTYGETQGGLFDLYSSGSGGFGFAKGGAFTPGPLSDHVNQVHTRPTQFAFARGGIFSEYDAEAIMPLARGPDGSLGVRAQGVGAGTVVQVINNSGGQARTERGTTPEGGDFIKVIIDRAVGAVNENILKQGGSTGRAIASTFGLSRAGTPVSG